MIPRLAGSVQNVLASHFPLGILSGFWGKNAIIIDFPTESAYSYSICV